MKCIKEWVYTVTVGGPHSPIVGAVIARSAPIARYKAGRDMVQRGYHRPHPMHIEVAEAGRIWTDEQVAMLNAHQLRGDVHPYTCPGDYPECANQRELLATSAGWVCACGKYRQTWAHGVAVTVAGG